MDRKIYVRQFQDDTVDIFRVYVKPGVVPQEVRRQIVDRLGSHHRLFVMLNHEVRDYIMKIADQWLGMTYLQVIVAVAVALLGHRQHADRFHFGPASRTRCFARGRRIAGADPRYGSGSRR